MTDLSITTPAKKLSFALILVQGSESQTPFTALKVAQSIINQNHALEQVFLFHDAAHLANKYRHIPKSHQNIQALWQSFAKQHNVTLNVCISAAIKRGVYNDAEAQRYNIPTPSIADGFELVGLGELAEIINGCDKVITLGRFQA